MRPNESRTIDTFDTFYSDLGEVIEFDERLTTLSGLIGSVTRPGDHCVHGRLFIPMPRIEAGAAGVLSFPIPQAQAQDLVADADRAPYGRGQETIVDPSVRDCWQLAPDRIRIAGRTWADTLGDILDRTTVGLGCPEGAVTAELYKLLIYERGGFFAPHRDTEKADGMVATLVISLPVPGAGGELVIRHRGRETVVDMRTDEPSELVYAAFCADCEHEILPVTDGHRVCLVYNLMLQDGSDTPLEAPDYGAEIDRIAAELGARCRDPGASGKLIWLLEHDYSAAGLSFGTLKNVDAAIGRVLTAAAERAGCALHAAIVRVEETGAGWYYGYADVAEDITDREFELYDIVDVDCRLDGWARPDGAPAGYDDLPLLPGELMPAGRLDPERPDSQRLFEASGNEGATIERLYRRAALVVWPKADSARLLAQAGAGSLAAFLAGEWQRASEGTPTCGPIRDLAAQVVDFWPSSESHRRRSEGDSWEGHSARFLLSRSRLPPAPPTDWIISAEGLSCDCEHCAELRRFCADPDSETLRMPVRKELRRHLRVQIEQGGIDIRCETERRGRPYTLVCVKTRGAFERRLRQYADDIAAMRQLQDTAGAIPSSADTALALRDAIARSH